MWKSGDRKTVWTKKYEKVLPDGTTVVWEVEKVSVLRPMPQQVVKVKQGQLSVMKVRPVSEQFYDKTGELVSHKSYYTFSQSFHGGPGSSRDILGGFNTGQYAEVFEETYKKNLVLIKKQGFVKA